MSDSGAWEATGFRGCAAGPGAAVLEIAFRVQGGIPDSPGDAAAEGAARVAFTAALAADPSVTRLQTLRQREAAAARQLAQGRQDLLECDRERHTILIEMEGNGQRAEPLRKLTLHRRRLAMLVDEAAADLDALTAARAQAERDTRAAVERHAQGIGIDRQPVRRSREDVLADIARHAAALLDELVRPPAPSLQAVLLELGQQLLDAPQTPEDDPVPLTPAEATELAPFVPVPQEPVLPT